MLRKLLICPYFGPLPVWFEHWWTNINRLRDDGYHLLFLTDEDDFAARVERVLEVTYPRGDGRKSCDYRCAFGELYAHELQKYDYWGHTDLDCVYGRVGHFLPDDLLDAVDIFSNHDTYVSGPWSLYSNELVVNQLFREVEGWQDQLASPTTTGWVETSFSRHVDDQHNNGRIIRRYESWQTRNLEDFSAVHWDGDRLMEGREEIMVAHFRRTKVYPPQLI